MKTILPLIALTGMSFAQPAQEKAETDLRLAQDQLKKLVTKITAEEGDLVRSVEKLDDEVIDRNKALTKLLSDEEGIAGKQRQLDNELARRKGEFEFTLSSLRSYGGSVKNRINVAEKQDFGKKIAAANEIANTAGDDLSKEIDARFSVMDLSIYRLLSLSGGSRFPGSAVGEGSVIKEGDFAMAGPISYFSAQDGSLAGFTTTTPESVDFPNIAPATEGLEEIKQLVSTGKASVPVDATMGKALQVARTKKTISDYLEGGGVVGYGILGLGGLAILIAIFKLIEINTFPIPSRKKVNLILDDLLSDRIPDADQKAKSLKGLGGEMAETGVKYFFDKRRILEDALLEKLGNIQPRLERFLPFLALVAAAAPMMGLLGTVLGIMQTFAMMSAVGTGDSRAFSAGISVALITTAMGLIVAIPVIIIHGMLKSLAKAKFGQAEAVALSILNGTTEIAERPSNKEEPDEMDERDLVTT